MRWLHLRKPAPQPGPFSGLAVAFAAFMQHVGYGGNGIRCEYSSCRMYAVGDDAEPIVDTRPGRPARRRGRRGAVGQ